jgi:hypothetical protein
LKKKRKIETGKLKDKAVTLGKKKIQKWRGEI